MNDPVKKIGNRLIFTMLGIMVLAIALVVFPIFGEWTRLIVIVLLSISIGTFSVMGIISFAIGLVVLASIIWTTIKEIPEHSRRKQRLNPIRRLGEMSSYPIRQLGLSETGNAKKNSQNKEFTIEDNHFTIADLSFLPDEIQWFGRDKNSNFVRMDVKVNDEWYNINSDLDDASLDKFLKRVPEKLKRSRYINRPEVRTYVGKKAHITTQNLQGIFEKQESVELHVTPLWMVVLHNGRVIRQHFIDDIVDIRSTKHPTDLDDDMQLLTFEVGEEAFAYALKDKSFVTRLSDATKDGIDSELMRKKKKQ